ncbi:MAG: hypothetical protein O2930_11465 [Acidobacteria bacterium]|nr:hypothetical protein [Acidobacteriota bacterium]
MNRIIFVPGKNPKPPVEQYRQMLLRCLRRGVERADPAVAQEIEADSRAFQLAGWNHLYYQSDKPLNEDLPWVEALLTQDGPTRQDVREALSLRSGVAWFLYTLADAFNVLIPLLPDPAVRATIQETARYFSNDGDSGRQVRELLKAPLRELFTRGDRILVIGHSMGSIVAYDALWELTHIEKHPGRVDLFLTIGSPLGMRFTQRRLLGTREEEHRRYPHNIRHWINMTSHGDLTALDATLHNDYRAMLTSGVIESITDMNGGIFNFFRNDLGLNVHRSYGYLVNPRVGEVIANWWKAGPAQ